MTTILDRETVVLQEKAMRERMMAGESEGGSFIFPPRIKIGEDHSATDQSDSRLGNWDQSARSSTPRSDWSKPK